MSLNTRKKLSAAFAGVFASEFINLLWYLPDVRVHEGLDWRFELACYALTLFCTIFFGWLASD